MPETRKSLWALGMPTPGKKESWMYVGGSYYVDVADKYVPRKELDEALFLLREARFMIPHADESSRRRNDWCAQADVLLHRHPTKGKSNAPYRP